MNKYVYDICLRWSVTNQCNFNCTYCTSIKGQKPIRIEISPLLEVLERTNKTFRIDFIGGGEPFMVSNIIDACKKLTQKHYVMFITNLVSDKIKQLADEVDPQRVMYLSGSFQIKQLQERKLVGRFVENYNYCKERGFELHTSIVAYPEILNELEEWISFLKTNGIEDTVISPYFGNYKGKEYPRDYSTEEIVILSKSCEKFKDYIAASNSNNELCNAGFNIASVDQQGNVRACKKIRESLGNVYKEIRLKDRMTVCSQEQCNCPVRSFDKYLFQKAQSQNG